MKCPLCGSTVGGVSAGWQRSNVQAFASGAISVAPGVRYSRTEPARKASLESDVTVPLLQSLATGVFAGVVSGAISSIIDWNEPAIVGLATAALSSGLVWAALVRDHNASLWKIEEITGVDLDGDGIAGKPAPAPEKKSSPMMVFSPTEIQRQNTDRARFETFVQDCARETGQNYWEQTRGIERGDYMTWRDTLVRLGWARWRAASGARNQGWELAFPPDEIIQGMFQHGSVRR